MTKWSWVAGLVVATLFTAGCNNSPWSEEAPLPAPSFTVFRRQALANGHGIALSVRGEIQPSDIEKIAAKERRVLVHVLVYTPDQTVSEEKPAAFWEHTQHGLRQVY